MSDWSTFCDAVITDLQTNVTGLDTTTVPAANVHRYAPWDPSELSVGTGRNLAVWPTGEAETPNPLATGAHELTQSYVVLVWEDSTESDARQVGDQTTDATFLTLHNAARARFYVTANQLLGGGNINRVWYAGTTFRDSSGPVRWFAMRIDVRAYQAFTP